MILQRIGNCVARVDQHYTGTNFASLFGPHFLLSWTDGRAAIARDHVPACARLRPQTSRRAPLRTPRHRGSINVCSLDGLRRTVDRPAPATSSRCCTIDTLVPKLATVPAGNHLRIDMHDISRASPGMTHPSGDHVADLLGFVRRWDGEAPLVIHCLAGISRSTAAAFITACALNPDTPEAGIARKIRALSPTASPNILLVELADDLLRRQGRMIEAIEAIGYGEMASEGWPFTLPARWEVEA